MRSKPETRSEGDKKSMPRPLLNKAVALVAVLIVVVTLFWFSRAPRIRVSVAQVDRGEVSRRISADGYFRAIERQQVVAFAEGDLTRVSLRTGDSLSKGQVIATLFWDMKTHPIRSPIRRVVSQVFRETAGPIRRGEAIIEVIDPDRLEIRAELLTPDAARVEKGDLAWVTGWGESDSVGDEGAIRARVYRISRAGFIKPSSLGLKRRKPKRFFNRRRKTTARILLVSKNWVISSTQTS